MKAYKGRRGKDPLGLNFDAIWGEWLNSRLGPGLCSLRWPLDIFENINILLLSLIKPLIFLKCVDSFNISQFLSADPSEKEKNTEVYNVCFEVTTIY